MHVMLVSIFAIVVSVPGICSKSQPYSYAYPNSSPCIHLRLPGTLNVEESPSCRRTSPQPLRGGKKKDLLPWEGVRALASALQQSGRLHTSIDPGDKDFGVRYSSLRIQLPRPHRSTNLPVQFDRPSYRIDQQHVRKTDWSSFSRTQWFPVIH